MVKAQPLDGNCCAPSGNSMKLFKWVILKGGAVQQVYCRNQRLKQRLLCISHVIYFHLFGLVPWGGLPSQVLPSCVGIFHTTWKMPFLSYTLVMSGGQVWGEYAFAQMNGYVQAHTKSLQLKPTCPSLFNRGRQPQLCIQLGVSLWSVFVSSVSHGVDPGAPQSCLPFSTFAAV